MRTIKRPFGKEWRSMVFSLICIICLCAQECDTSWLDAAGGIMSGIAVGLLSSTNENHQLAGLGMAVTALAVNSVRSNSVDYNPDMWESFANLGYAVSGNNTNPETKSSIQYTPFPEPQTDSPISYTPFPEPQTDFPIPYTPFSEPQNFYYQSNNGEIVTATGGKITPPPAITRPTSGRAAGVDSSLSYRQDRQPLTTRDSGRTRTNLSQNSNRSRQQGAEGSLSYTQNNQEPTPRNNGIGSNNQQNSNLPNQSQARAATAPGASSQILIPFTILQETSITAQRNDVDITSSFFTPQKPKAPEVPKPSLGTASGGSPQKGPSISALNLTGNAEVAAQKIKERFQNIVFTSGRRDLSSQARAMAANIYQEQDPDWIKKVYKASDLCTLLNQAVVDNWSSISNDKAKIEQLLNQIFSQNPSKAKVFSYHFTGQAFDIQPRCVNEDELRTFVQTLPGFKQFLTREGGAERWHIAFD